MKIINNKLMLLALVGVMAGCTNNPSKEVSSDINAALNANKEAKSYGEWEASDFHPEELFEKWLKDQALSAEVCKQLLEKEGQDLTLFEEQIKDEKYKDLVKDCKRELQKKMDKYWKEERAKMGVKESSIKAIEGMDVANTAEELSFRFPDNVQKRDLSNGYYTLSGDVAKKEVVLTFDDGPHGVYTDQILKTLASVNAKVIFFATSNSVKGNPEVLKRVAKAGHAIGGHSNTHRCLASNQRCQNSNKGGRLSFKEATEEIAGSLRSVYNVLGWVDPFFRFPFGESDPNLKDYLRKNSIGEFYWSIDSNDWRQKTPMQVVSDTMAQIESRGRGVVLFHDIQKKTAEALPTFLKQLYYKGYSVVLLKPSNDTSNFKSQVLN